MLTIPSHVTHLAAEMLTETEKRRQAEEREERREAKLAMLLGVEPEAVAPNRGAGKASEDR